MRVSQISVYRQQNPYSAPQKKVNQQSHFLLSQPENEINFKGKFGAWLGAFVGGAAVVATAFVTAPAVACFAGAGAFLGAVGTDAAEDAINGKKEDDD